MPRALKYQDLRQKHQSAISEARMRSRLGISISVGTLDLIECGPAAEEGQSPHDHIPLYFIAAPSTAARRPSGTLSQESGEHDGTAHINGMLATSHPCRTRYAAASALSGVVLHVCPYAALLILSTRTV